MLKYSRYLKPLSRDLRRNPTDSEQLLWSRLRRRQLLGVQFYRQKGIGPYIVDFYAARPRLVIEVDGSQHLTPEGLASDAKRDTYLNECGLLVLRFDGRQVLQETAAVIAEIHKVVESRL